MKIPETKCEGCKSRDRVIEILAKQIDAVEGRNLLEVPTIEEMCGLVPDLTGGLSLREYMDDLRGAE